MPTTILSDGEELDVRTLGIAELDHLAPAPIPKYAYKMQLITGDTEYVEFPLERYTEPPEKPAADESEIQPKTPDWYRLKEWQVYQAALYRERERAESTIAYLDSVFTYILDNCINASQAHRIVTDEDWDKVYWLALVPQLSKDLLVQVLRQTYKATYKDQELFAAMDKISGGSGIYDALRVWEGQLMITMGLTEDLYAAISLQERARKVVALKIDDWLGVLEADDRLKKMKADEIARSTQKR